MRRTELASLKGDKNSCSQHPADLIATFVFFVNRLEHPTIIMAQREKGYGMTAEIRDRIDSKLDPQLRQQAHDWIQEVTGECFDEFVEGLKDGVILCKLINILQPESVKKINKSTMAFKMMENTGNFLAACEAYGMKKGDLFQTVDLYEAQNIPQVINGIHALGRKASAKGFCGPTLGPKESDANVREFSDDQLKHGQNVIGLQMGSNKGASQAGSTPYGLGRQIEHGTS